MRVAHGLGDRAARAATRSRKRAADRRPAAGGRRTRSTRDPPVLVAVGLRGDEPRRRSRRCGAAAAGRSTRATATTVDGDARAPAQRERGHGAHAAARAALARRRRARAQPRRRRAEHDQHGEHRRALRRAAAGRLDAPGSAHGRPAPAARPPTATIDRRAQPRARRRSATQHGEAGGRRAQRAAGEREVAGRGRAAGAAPRPQRRRARRCHAGEHEPDARQRAHRVPVGQRPGEPVAGRRQRRERERRRAAAAPTGRRARRSDDPGQQHRLDQARTPPAAARASRGGERGEVEQQALEVVDRRRRRSAPRRSTAPIHAVSAARPAERDRPARVARQRPRGRPPRPRRPARRPATPATQPRARRSSRPWRTRATAGPSEHGNARARRWRRALPAHARRDDRIRCTVSSPRRADARDATAGSPLGWPPLAFAARAAPAARAGVVGHEDRPPRRPGRASWATSPRAWSLDRRPRARAGRPVRRLPVPDGAVLRARPRARRWRRGSCSGCGSG